MAILAVFLDSNVLAYLSEVSSKLAINNITNEEITSHVINKMRWFDIFPSTNTAGENPRPGLYKQYIN